MNTIHDPRDYAADPSSLPPGSFIAQCLALGVRFELQGGTWFARAPFYVTAGATQVEAARKMVAHANRGRA